MESAPDPKPQSNGNGVSTDTENNTIPQSKTQENNEAQGQPLLSQPSQGPTSNPIQSMDPSITADEIALYDRQIRLWGVKAQEKIRSASILLIGMKGLGNEIAKNLVLSGISTLTIVDDGLVTEEDLGAQFLIREKHVGMPRAQAALPELQKLNPRVKVNVFNLDGLFTTNGVFEAFSLTIATDMSCSDSSTINNACRLANRPYYAAATYGMYGYIFADLISHDFIISRDKSNIPTKIGSETATRSIISASTSKGSDGKVTELVTKRETYTPLLLANSSPLPAFHLSSRRRKANVTPVLSCLRALWEYQSQTNKSYPSHTKEDLALFTRLATKKHQELQLPSETLKSDVLRSFLQNLGCEISPVCAFLGGQLAQDVINVVGGKEQPIQNTLIFDAEETKGPIYALHTSMVLPVTNQMPVQAMAPMPADGMGLDMGMGMPMGMGMEMPMMDMNSMGSMGMGTDFPMMPTMDMTGGALPSMDNGMPMAGGNLQGLQPQTVLPAQPGPSGGNAPQQQAQGNGTSNQAMPPPSG